MRVRRYAVCGLQLELMGPKSVRSGKTVLLVCSTSDGEPVRFTWYRSGLVLNNVDKIKIHNSPESSVLTLFSVSQADSGNYTCLAGNGLVEQRITSALTVEGNCRPVS